MHDQDLGESLTEQVRAAAAAGTPLRIAGGDSKAFHGRQVDAGCTSLCVAGHTGVVAYEPTELAITLRAGTPLAEVEALLAEQGQQLPFEPPAFGPGATIGGAVASGLAGPRRPFSGAARDAVLGVQLINGHGERLDFGGRVMKNVAGYDVSRLMAGAQGTLGVLLEVSLKVLPSPQGELTLVQELSASRALERMTRWSRQALPITGLCHADGRLYVRLGGGEQTLAETRQLLGGEALGPGPSFWADLKEQRLPFFGQPGPLWRLSLPPATPLQDEGLLDWGGAQRWVIGDLVADELRERVARAGGHATLFRHHDGRGEVFHPLPAPLLALHRRVKQALDPQRLFNPGRLYAEL